MSLIIWETWFRGRKPLLLSQNWKGLILSRPMLAASMRPKSLWNFKTESSWPGLKSFTGFRIEITCAGDKSACIMAESCITPENVIGRKYEPNRLCNSVHRCPGVTEEPEQHPCTWWMYVGTRLGWKEELYIGKLLPRKQTWETFCVLAECQCESRPPFKHETHCTIFGRPRWKIGIVKQSWQFLWSWLVIGGPTSHSETGSKTAVVMVLRPKIAYDSSDCVINLAWSSHSVFTATTHVYWPANTNATWNQHDMALKLKSAYLKLLFLPLFSAHIKTTTAKVWFIMLFLFTTSACWWRFIFL